jgi:hypothetical protein
MAELNRLLEARQLPPLKALSREEAAKRQN